MARFTRTLAAGTGDRLNVSGTVIKVIETSGLVTITPDNRNEAHKMQGGDTWTLKDPVQDPTFKTLEIANETTGAITFTLEIYSASHDILVADGTNVNVGVHGVTQSGAWSMSQSGTWDILTSEKIPTANADGTVNVLITSTSIVAASALNRVVSIQPRGGSIYIRKGAAATAALGILVENGQLYECETTQQIFGISPLGTIATFFDITRA